MQGYCRHLQMLLLLLLLLPLPLPARRCWAAGPRLPAAVARQRVQRRLTAPTCRSKRTPRRPCGNNNPTSTLRGNLAWRARAHAPALLQ